MRRFLFCTATAALIGAAAMACSGDDDGDETPTAGAGTPQAQVSVTGTQRAGIANDATVAAARTLTANATVLPGGMVVAGNGALIPAPAATEAAQIATASAAQPTPQQQTPQAGATEPPLCVIRPVPGCATPPTAPTATNQSAEGVAFDSDANAPGVQTSVNAANGQEFTLTLSVVSAPEAYQAYEWTAVVSGPVAYAREAPAKTAGLDTCPEVSQVDPAGAWYGGCINTNTATTYTGVVGTVTFRCTGAGTATIHLRRQSEPGSIQFFSGLLAPGGLPITGTTGPDITVTCA